jgi:hypothetical protein
MELKNNQVIVLKNGKIGVTSSFNGKPFQLIFDTFTMPIRRLDENLEAKNSNYDVVEVYDGSTIEEVTDVFEKGYTTEGLKAVWKRG